MFYAKKDASTVAISDLRDHIQTMTVLDPVTQTNVRMEMMQRLHDSSSDVQAIAVNCLSEIVQKFGIHEVMEILGVLSKLSLSGDEDASDIYAQGLRTILEHVPAEHGQPVAERLLPVMCEGILSTVS